MIRVVVETCDASMAANVGGSVHRTLKTFDIEAPELEAFLRERQYNTTHRQVMGVEVVGCQHEYEAIDDKCHVCKLCGHAT